MRDQDKLFGRFELSLFYFLPFGKWGWFQGFGWILFEHFQDDFDGFVQLGIAACQDILRAVLDDDVGVDALVFDDPLHRRTLL